jgi:hypothetical protein
VRIDLVLGRTEPAVRGVQRVREEPGFHRLVLVPQQEFEVQARCLQVAAIGIADSQQPQFGISLLYPLFIVSAALICGFEPQHNSTHCTNADNHHVRLVGQPVTLSRTPSKMAARPPEFGEQTDEVLAEFGFSAGEIVALKQAWVL